MAGKDRKGHAMSKEPMTPGRIYDAFKVAMFQAAFKSRLAETGDAAMAFGLALGETVDRGDDREYAGLWAWFQQFYVLRLTATQRQALRKEMRTCGL